jgi:hypothetical protein
MRPVAEWDESDLDELHRGEIMESLTLEYKDSRALGNTDHQKTELFKDVSAMANSQGGIIVYGMKEIGHLPTGTDDGVEPSKIKREWLENILSANIDPKIEDLLIKPVILTSKGTGNVAYILDIPKQSRAVRTRGRSTNTTSGTTSKPSRWCTMRYGTSCGAASSTAANMGLH